MPVGALNSPNTSRITLVHSPVVTPAFAASTEACIILVSDSAANFKLARDLSTSD